MDSLIEALRTSVAIYTILIGAVLFGYFLAITQTPQKITAFLVALDFGAYGTLALILAFFLIMGCILDAMAMIILLVPIVFPVVTQANAALRNEELRGVEAGIDWRPAEGVALLLTAFDNRLKNAIANVTLGANLRQRQNLPAIETQGIEAGLRVERGAIRFDANLSFSDPRIVGEGASLALDGNAPPQSPRWMAAASIGYAPADGTIISLSLRHVGAQFEDDLETDVLPAFTTLGAYAQVPLVGQLDLVLRAENLFDETIVTRNDGGDLDLGAPRTFWAGLRYGF